MAEVNIRIKALVGPARQAIASVKRELAGIKPAAQQADSGSDFGKTKAGLQSISQQLSSTKKQLIGLFAGLPALGSLKQLVQLAELAKTIDARLKIATKSSYEFAEAQARVRQMSLDTGTALEANIGLFSKLRVNAGLAQQDALKLTGLIAKASQLDGGGASADAAIFQLQQALASGVLRGQELNSVLEQTPSIAKAIADGLGVSIGKMRELSANGELTAGKVKEALFKMADEIEGKFAQLPVTTSRAFQNISTNAITALGDLDKTTGITDKIAVSLKFLADHMKAIVALLAGAFLIALQAAVVALGRWAAAIVAQQVAATRAATINYTYMTSIAGVGRAATVATGAVGRLTVAAGLLRGALALVGGPVGILITALLSLGIYLYDKFANAKTQIEQTQVAASGLAETLGKISGQVVAATSAIKSQYDAAIGRVKAASKEIEDSYKAQTEVILSEMQRRMAVADEQAEAEKQRNKDRYASEEGQIQANLQTVIDAETQKRKAIAEASVEALATWNQTYERLVQAAKLTGEKTLEIEREATAAKIGLVSKFEAAYRGTINNLIAEERRLLDEVRQRGEERANLERSVEDIIRNLKRGTMDEYGAYQDKLREADQKQAQARALIAKGDQDSLKAGQKLAEEAMRLSQTTAGAVTRTVVENGKTITETVVSQNQATQKSISEVKESARLAAEAMRKLDESQIASATQARSEADLAKTQLEAMSAEGTKLKVALKDIVKLDIAPLEAALNDAKQLAEANRISIEIEADMALLTAQLDELSRYPDRLPKLMPEIELSADKLREQMAALGETAKENGIEMPVGVNLEDAQRKLSDFQTEVSAKLSIESTSKHQVDSNFKQVEAQINSLNGKNTTSTHTVITRNVSANNAGGLIAPVARFSRGGSVGFPRMSGGVVPGTGDQDTVPRTLEAGSFVLKRAAVDKYGMGKLSGLMQAVRGFAAGGQVSKKKRNLDVIEALNLIELGFEGANIYAGYLKKEFGTSVVHDIDKKFYQQPSDEFVKRTNEDQAVIDRNFLQNIAGQQDLGNLNKAKLEDIKTRWRQQMRQSETSGIDLEVELQKRMKRYQGFAAGGHSADTVPAMLTPGEVVIDKSMVRRLGLGFFHALNDLKAPQRILGFNKGGIVPGAPLPNIGGRSNVSKVVNVTLKLPNGQNRNVQTVGDTDGNLLDALRIAGLSA